MDAVTRDPQRSAESGRQQPPLRRAGRGDLFEPSFTFLRVRGIPVGAHWSWLVVLALVAWTLAVRFFPLTYPGLGTGTYWTMGIAAAVAFFASILLHELGHAIAAVRRGVQMEGITLWLFGGVARFSSNLPSPAVEFRIAVAGPIISLVLTVAFGLAGTLGDQLATPVAGVFDYLARINALVLGFNLVPALPLDGGRLLRAWLWHRQQSFEAATQSAARAGRIFGYMLVGIGVLGLFTGAGTGGLWTAFVGWFLVQAAKAEALHARLRSVLEGLHVRDVMSHDPSTASRHWTIERLLDEAVGPKGHSTYPVVEDGTLEGLISLRRAVLVRPGDRVRSLVEQVMLPRAETPTLSPETPLGDALDIFASYSRAVVVDDGDHPIGILSASDVSRAMRRRELTRVPGTPPVKRAGVAVWVVVAGALFLSGAVLYHPPFAVFAPGATLDLAADLTVRGTSTDEIEGTYLLTSVQVSRPNALGMLIGLFHPDQDVVPLSAVIPADVEPGQFVERQRQLFDESRMLAAAAAAQAAGMEVAVNGTGARVVQTLPGSPAAEHMRPDDVIVSINGQDVDLAKDVATEVSSRPGGTQFRFIVERDGTRRDVTLRSTELEGRAGQPAAIGVLLETRGFDIRIPFEIDFEDSGVGGPSAGLAYALAIYDVLAPENLAQGRSIGATGTITPSGDVGPVGGLEQKAAALESAGAQLFIVPQGDIEKARAEGMEVRGVADLEEAIDLLQGSSATPNNGDPLDDVRRDRSQAA